MEEENAANTIASSPKDQAILEAEYKQNPKPNKAARAEIVEKVDLNEKEVQVGIYFVFVATWLKRVISSMLPC
jgi:hypothetical protein